MADSEDDRRRWPRVTIDKAAKVRAGGRARAGKVSDLSAGGASIEADAADLGENETEAGVAIDGFGEFEGAIVRHWDDGVALEFDIADDDQYALQEELEAFRRENDLDWE